MRFLFGFLLGLILGTAVTVALTTTDTGRNLMKPLLARVSGAASASAPASGTASTSAAEASVVAEVLAKLKDAAESAESYAGRVASGAKLEDLAAELRDAAKKGGAEAGALWIQGRQAAIAEAEKAPDLDNLGDSLGGWEKQLAAYEMAQHAADKNDKDAEQTESKIAATFSSPGSSTPQGPASAGTASSGGATAGGATGGEGKPGSGAFQPLSPFYKCPVMEVSNSGPTAPDRTLTSYTPWVKTAAGVLIRAPITAACLSSGFGDRVAGSKTENHPGVDYYNRSGGPIYAAGPGVVTFAESDPSYGYSVKIDHGSGVEGHYAHMVPGSLKVHKGDHVTQGQLIGQMGHSGRAYAVHLHYELRYNGQLVDPLYVGKAGPAKKPAKSPGSPPKSAAHTAGTGVLRTAT
jgi:murein DD-endopeptidase MepM/ murein hydrolase activator NlpD